MSRVPLPIPPVELRELIGGHDADAFENPSGRPIFDGLPDGQWRSYLDFGCGCGRSARRLALQYPRPERYVGLDLHHGMVRWCQENLQPVLEGFAFLHHDVFNPGLNPDRSRPWALPLPVADDSVSLIEATSVFTHLVEGQTEFYLDEVARILTSDGVLQATFFLFDKSAFPFLQPTQNALYVNPEDPTNAVAFDRGWLIQSLEDRGLCLIDAGPPEIRGFHWHLRVARVGSGHQAVSLPDDTAPVGHRPPPALRAGAAAFGPGVNVVDDVRIAVRAALPEPDPLAAELTGATQYIASLEQHLAAERDHVERLLAALAVAQGR